MPTTSDSLGSSLPFPSVPPKTIFPSSSSKDVKLWVYHVLKENDEFLNNNNAWALARGVKGTGKNALRYSREDWEKEVPGWGHTIYLELNQPDKYVVNINEVKLSSYLYCLFSFIDRYILRNSLGYSSLTSLCCRGERYLSNHQAIRSRTH